MAEEELINQFERACALQDYTEIAATLRFSRHELRRNPSKTNLVPVKELLGLLKSCSDNEVIQEIRSLLQLYFETTDFSSLHSTFGDDFTCLLSSKQKEVIMVGLDYMQKGLVPEASSALQDEVLNIFLDLFADEDTGISSYVSEILCKSDLLLIRRDWTESYLRGLENRNSLVRSRLAALLASIPENTNRWSKLKSLLKDGDDLEKMVALQNIQEQILNTHDAEGVDSSGLLDMVISIAQQEDAATYLRSQALETFAGICDDMPFGIESFEERFRLEPFLHTLIIGPHQSLMSLGYLCAATLAIVVESPWIERVILDISFAEPIFKGAAIESIAAMNAIALIMKERSVTLSSRQQKLFDLLTKVQDNPPIDAIIAKTKAFDKDVKMAAYNLLNSLLSHQWAVNEAICNSKLIPFILDRNNEHNIDGLYAKFDLAKALLTDDIDIPVDLNRQLNSFVGEGPVYAKAQHGVAIDERTI